ncbi:2-amino-4-hydroxy-6-hydroxymethyldihydropteridine diphosphokinase [Cellulomonas iranensis]|uniref:2-amino-4-hydroxy-6- hydroxymethyldihydropteridine diphosphokinase n=1 Tax=Cellulomonas iranensis TaxID=76862 RepID=UPI003D7DBD84
MSGQDDVHDDGGRRLDQIRLSGISATGYHGVFAHERREGQTFVADVVVHLDTRRAAAGDDLAHTVDYGEVAQLVAAVLSGEPADLIETVAERIAATVLARPHVQAVDVALHKPQAPITVPFGDVVVAIRRDRTKLPAAEPYRPPTGAVRRDPEPDVRPRTAPLPVTGPTHAASAPVVAAAPGPARADADTGPDGVGAVVVPAPSGAVPTGVLPAVAAATALAAAAPGPVPPPVVTGPTGPVPGTFGAGPSEPVPSPATAPRAHLDADDDGPATQLMAPVDLPDHDAQPFDAPEHDASAYAEPAYAEPRYAEPASDQPAFDQPAYDVPAHETPAAPPLDGPATQLMAPVADVVEGELVLDALDEPPAAPVRAVLALGANLGPAQETLRQAVADLASVPGIEVVAVSPLARTAAIGPEQPDYLNAVLVVRTTLAPRDLLRAVHAVEQHHGRERLERWGPRTLDVDIVVYGDTLAVTDDLELPHPRAHQRAFVLEPWAQVEPDAMLPGLGGGPVAQLAATAPDRDGVRWMALDWLTAPVPAASPEPDADGAGPGEARLP